MALGNGEYDVVVADRNGVIFGQLNVLSRMRITWERDDYGELEIVMNGPSVECCVLLQKIYAVRHEIIVFRNGLRVWEGPITRIGWYRDRIEIDAKDASWYLTRRVLTAGFDHSGQSVSAIDVVFDMLQAHYPASNDPFRLGEHLEKITTDTDARTAAKVDAYTSTVYATLQQYADRGGIDYLVRGRKIILLDTNTRVQQLSLMHQEHFFDELAIVEYGAELRTRSFAKRQDGGVSSAVAPQEWLDYYGTIDGVAQSQSDGQTAAGDDALDDLTERQLQRSYPTPREVQVPTNSGVRPDAPFDFEELLPGSFVPVEVNTHCISMRRLMRIDTTRVQLDDGGEFVSITMLQAPATIVDAT